MAEEKNPRQFIWGILLVLAGAGVCYRIPQVIEKIEQISSVSWFARICLYLMGIILIGSGSQKIFAHFRKIDIKD